MHLTNDRRKTLFQFSFYFLELNERNEEKKYEFELYVIEIYSQSIASGSMDKYDPNRIAT